MKCSRTNAGFVTIAVLLTVALVICVVLVGFNTRETYNTTNLLFDAQYLSSELRTISDDLTRFIRTYTVTGNESYWDFYNEVVNIQNGISRLPKEPYRVYWDLLISDGVPPRGFDPPKSLSLRMKEAAFTSEELRELEEALRESDALIDLETVAYNAMHGRYRPSNGSSLDFTVIAPPNQTLAMELVHSVYYHHWVGRIMRSIDRFTDISERRIKAKISYSNSVNIVILAVLGIIIFFFILLFCLYMFVDMEHIQVVKVLEKQSRDVKNAPKKRVAIIFTDVQNSTPMWEKHSEEMREAMAIHHNTIREVIKKHKAYEVKTIGDSFMITTDNADSAVHVTNDIQSELLVQPWPEKILDTPDACVKFQDEKLVFKGLRVRIGIDIGNPEVVYDEVSKGYDYYGDVTNSAARVQAVAYGGQTLITNAVYSELSPAVRDECNWIDVGKVALKGMTEKKHLYQTMPKDLVRHFTVPRDDTSYSQSSLGDRTSTLSGPRRDIEEMTMIEIVKELRRFRAAMPNARELAELKRKSPNNDEREMVPEVQDESERQHKQTQIDTQTEMAVSAPPSVKINIQVANKPTTSTTLLSTPVLSPPSVKINIQVANKPPTPNTLLSTPVSVNSLFHEVERTGQVLGEGAFGIVELVRHKTKPNKVFAMKIIPCVTSKNVRSIQREIDVLSCVQDDALLSCYDVYYSRPESTVYIISEFMDKGSLHSQIRKSQQGIPESVAQYIFYLVVQGLCSLHKANHLHRDIKPHNILLSTKPSTIPVKISDFGLSRDYGAVESDAKTFCGTLLYMAPERLESRGVYDTKSDVWAVGVTVVEALTGRHPLADLPLAGDGISSSFFTLYQRLKQGSPPRLPSGQFSKEAHEFVSRACCVDPKDRASSCELFSLPWLTSALEKKGAYYTWLGEREGDAKM